eukprot:4970335-Pleurochrysis_carterae.AAC.5
MGSLVAEVALIRAPDGVEIELLRRAAELTHEMLPDWEVQTAEERFVRAHSLGRDQQQNPTALAKSRSGPYMTTLHAMDKRAVTQLLISCLCIA